MAGTGKEWARSGGDGRGPVIAIDGPGGVGKTTVSRMLAERLGFRYIDTGAMYRALAVAAAEAGVDLDSDTELEGFCSRARVEFDPATSHVTVNGVDYSGRIRTPEAGDYASRASSREPVRRLLTRAQRRLGREAPVVMEGRDIGTVVFPDADMKFFLDAAPEVRARRRHGELAGADLARVNEELEKRDRRDSSRKNAPLKKADDAIYVDTGELTIEGVLDVLLGHLRAGGVIGSD